MRYRMVVAVGFVGAVATAAAAFAQTASPQPTPSNDGAQGKKGAKFRQHDPRRLVHSESKVQAPDKSFVTVIVDHGEVTGVSGNTVTIKRLDGESVSVTATDTTKIRRNGEDAAIGTLVAGDRAHISQIVKADGTRTVGAIRVHSADFKPERKHGRRMGGGDPNSHPANHPANFGVDVPGDAPEGGAEDAPEHLGYFEAA